MKKEMVEVTVIEQGKAKKVRREKMVRPDAEWIPLLSPEAFKVTRQGQTEPACKGGHESFQGKGVFVCIGCGSHLFTSETKFESGTGWPSFWNPVAPENIERKDDFSFGMRRTEVLCSVCGAHLGHLFEDGPPPTGLRYCINSVALQLIEEE